MMHIKTNYPLSSYNTFQIEVRANYFVDVASIEELENLSENKLISENKRLILGGGSNILFTHDFKGLVIHPKFMGIEKIDEDNSGVLVRVGSGVLWDDLVIYAVDNNLGGIENLSIIPGNVGASPIQNIGAYGVEAKNVIEKVEGFHLSKRKFYCYSNKDCQFGYRTSIFKQDLKNDFLITHVTYRLTKPPHILKTNYGIIEEKLSDFPEKSISVLRDVITDIRNSKLPNPEDIGNAGSFFKNPIIPGELAFGFKDQYPDIPVYPAEKGKMKLSAAWLIDNANCKGIRKGNAGTHEKQPLVLLNLGKASGEEIIDLAKYIQEEVMNKFGVHLEPEVNIV